MNSTQHRLLENDVRKDAPDLAADEFLRLYLESNFPQTVSHPSAQQKEQRASMQPQEDAINYMKKPQSGTSFDRPDRY
jgi:hypothetical protein